MRASYNEWKYFHSRSIFCAENEFFVRKSSMKPVYIVKGRMSGPTVNGKTRANENEEGQSHQGTRESRGTNGACFMLS